MVIPMPCEGRLFFKVSTAVAKRWEADNPGKKMTMDHFETVRSDEYGAVTVIWDAPQPSAVDQ